MTDNGEIRQPVPTELPKTPVISHAGAPFPASPEARQGLPDPVREAALREAMSALPAPTENIPAQQLQEVASLAQVLGNPQKPMDERRAAAINSGIPKQELRDLLTAQGMPENEVDAVLAAVPEGPSLAERVAQEPIDPNNPEAAPTREELQTAVKDEIPDIRDLVGPMKGIAAGDGPLSDEETAIMESAQDAITSWKEKAEKAGKLFGKGLVTAFLTLLVTYIFLLKLYAGAAAKRK